MCSYPPFPFSWSKPMAEMYRFDPVAYSKEENEFFLAHLGKPTVVALREVKAPVNPRAVQPVLDRVNELEELRKHNSVNWVGVQALKDAIKVWLEQDARWEYDYLRTRGRAPRFPSMFSYDTKGRPHRSGPGSDTHVPKTYFDAKGDRHEFAVDLQPEFEAPWVSPGFTEKPQTTGLVVNQEANRIECFCGHTESFKADSRASYNAARARMSKHLRKETLRQEEHRDVHTQEFGN